MRNRWTEKRGLVGLHHKIQQSFSLNCGKGGWPMRIFQIKTNEELKIALARADE
jgi:hypothetical protein